MLRLAAGASLVVAGTGLAAGIIRKRRDAKRKREPDSSNDGGAIESESHPDAASGRVLLSRKSRINELIERSFLSHCRRLVEAHILALMIGLFGAEGFRTTCHVRLAWIQTLGPPSHHICATHRCNVSVNRRSTTRFTC